MLLKFILICYWYFFPNISLHYTFPKSYDLFKGVDFSSIFDKSNSRLNINNSIFIDFNNK